MACDSTEPCELVSRQKLAEVLLAQKEVDLARHPVAGLVLQVGGVRKFHQALGLKTVDSFL